MDRDLIANILQYFAACNGEWRKAIQACTTVTPRSLPSVKQQEDSQQPPYCQRKTGYCLFMNMSLSPAPSNSSKKKRKRLAPTLLSSVPSSSLIGGNVTAASSTVIASSNQDPVVLSLTSNNNNDDTTNNNIHVTLSHTPPCPMARVDTHADFQRLFSTHSDQAVQTYQKWARDPDAEWIQQLLQEIPNQESLEKLAKQLEVQGSSIADEDTFGKWEIRAEFATAIVELWFQDKTLEQVIEKTQDFGQMDFLQGLMLTGDCIREHIIQQAAPNTELGTFQSVFPILKKLADSKASLYTVLPENNFVLHPQQSISMSTLAEYAQQQDPEASLCSLEYCGSLNTTYDYSGGPTSETGVPLLDKFYEEMEELTAGLDHCIELNRRLYFIWKGPGYMTPHHQDSHVPPQITIYHQLSGISNFHFLPVLLGLYVNHVGKQDPIIAQQVLQQLDSRKIGSVATLKPGSVAMIFPFGSHGVFCPYPHRQLSTIRAAEFFVQQIRKDMPPQKCQNFMPLSQKDREWTIAFRQAQVDLMTRLEMDRQGWLFFARRMVDFWEQEKTEKEKESDDDNA